MHHVSVKIKKTYICNQGSTFGYFVCSAEANATNSGGAES